ncbi:TetR/AcrR family transcriptional regulator [Zavarzinia sp. CC-PAN008]|uniref:TetR/AcrR family transcriptional regulator n=1 Tax=Zavarzinia sp. CC-PAN008 TaxID=3243332 RepID=UPI003F745550
MSSIERNDRARVQRVSQAERTQRTRGALLAAARRLFAEGGFAATSTDEILNAAGVTRGALYHHFKDKSDLFQVLCTDLHGEAAQAIEAATRGLGPDPVAALVAGSIAWLEVMAQPAMRRILCIDAPAVLGWSRWIEIDSAHGLALLADGVRAAQGAGLLPLVPARDVALMLNGAMNALVMALPDPVGAADLKDAQDAVAALIRSLARNG